MKISPFINFNYFTGLKQNWLLRKTIQDAFESQHLHLTRRLTSATGNECLIEEQAEEIKQDQVIKIPTENRSQYEKLSSTQEEFSSDDEMGKLHFLINPHSFGKL